MTDADTEATETRNRTFRMSLRKNMKMVLWRMRYVNTLNIKNNTPLHCAAAFGQKEIVDILLSYNAEVDSRNKDNLTPLHLASYNGHTEIVEDMIRHGADVNACNSDNITPLHLATNNGHTEIVEALIQHGATVNACNTINMTPLHLSSGYGHTKIVETLIRHGATVNAFNSANMTPLHLSSGHGHKEIVETLIHHGATIYACNSANMTPLHLAAQNGHTSVVVIFLDNHATIDVMKQPETPLYLAAKNGHKDVVKELLHHSVSDFIAFNNEKIPLHIAIENGNTKVVEIMLEHSRSTFDKTMEDGYTLQENARKLDETRVFESIELKTPNGRCVSAGIIWAETNTPLELLRDSRGRNALEVAVENAQTKMVEMLVNTDPCLYTEKHLRQSFQKLTAALTYFGNYVNNEIANFSQIAAVLLKLDRFKVNFLDGKLLDSQLHQVVEMCGEMYHGHLIPNSKSRIQIADCLINLLLEKGADFNMKNYNGETALIIASENGCLHVIQILLDWQHKTRMKLDLDARDHCGVNALNKAAEKQHVKIVKLLLNNKASINLHDYYGFTALHSAIYETNRYWFDLDFFCKGVRKEMYLRNSFLPTCFRSRPTWESKSMNRYEAIKMLKENIRHKKKTDRFKEEIVQLLLGVNETITNAVDFRGNTPLDLARKSSIQITSATFKRLEHQGAIENLREPKVEAPVPMATVDERGRNPLHRLIISINGKIGQEREIFDLMLCGFLYEKEKFRHLATGTDEKRRTPLHYAVMPPSYICKLDPDLVRVLLEIGCSVNYRDIYDKTPLHYAEINEDCYDMLLRYGADENIKDRFGYTPRDLKQLRDTVRINADNTRQLPISTNRLYLSRKLNTNQVTDLKKQKVAERIKIFSQSPRCPESSEEAIWNIWIENDLIRLNRRVSQLATPVQHFMERLAHSIKEKDWRFECQPNLVGSAKEETKVKFSADFDFIFKLSTLSQICEMFSHPTGPEGFFQLRRKSNDDNTSWNDEIFDCFFNSEQYLLTHEVNSRFQLILEEVLSDHNFWKDEHLFEWNATAEDEDEEVYKKSPGLCKTVELRMLRPIDDGEGDLLFVNISIDIVACVYVEDPLPVGISTIVNGCMTVFDRPHFDPSNRRVGGFPFSETFARISFAPVESRIIKESSPLIKAAYIVCKMILYYDSKSAGYHLKNCLLFCMEALNARNARNRIETRNEDEITPTELAFWVERLMFCFMEFCRHDVYPCYLMPSFKQKVMPLCGRKDDWQSVKADNPNAYSDFIEIPFDYSLAYDTYLDLCPDDTAIDIAINQDDFVEGSLNANHDPTWEQFDREELIRKLSSRYSR